MAEHHDEATDENPARFTNIIAGLCLLIALGALGAFLAVKGKIPEVTEADFALEVPSVDKQRLAKERKSQYGNPDLSEAQEEIDELLDVIKRANLLQFGQPGMKEMHDMKVLTEHHANEVITIVGIEGFMPAGKVMFEGCIEGIDEVLAAVRSGELELDKAMEDPGQKYEKYKQWCGKALPALRRFQIVTPEGKWAKPAVGPTIFDIMNRFRWAAVLDLRKPPWEQLTPYEFELLTRWRAARADQTPERRVNWVKEASQTAEDLPVFEIIGNIYYQAGNFTAAQRAYQQACKARSSDLFLQRKCEFLNKKVGPASAEPTKS